MEQQKRIAAIHDLAGYGRCALAVALPVISAMGVECCPLPTAVLSTNAAFPGYFMEDYTVQLEQIMKHWEKEEFTFDGIYCGFLCSEAQVELVKQFLQRFKKENTIVLFDPVMGDYGKLYSAVSPGACARMKELLPYTDILTPNLTEACRLTGRDYQTFVPEKKELRELAGQLCEQGASGIVITGIPDGSRLMNYVCERGKEPAAVYARKAGGDRCGTGDVFASIVAAGVVRGMELAEAVEKAAGFISRAAAYTEEIGEPWRRGLCFERFLGELS